MRCDRKEDDMPSEHPSEVERRLAHKRAEAADMIGELRSRATVGHLSRQAAGKALPTLAALGPAAGRTAARNPIGSALMSAGLTWMLVGPEPDLVGAARKVASGTGSILSKTASTVSHTASSAIDTLGSTASRVAHGGSEIAEKVGVAGSALKRTANGAMRHAPVSDGSLIAAAAFAGGIAIGLVVMRRGA
jgi:hypothetical protein